MHASPNMTADHKFADLTFDSPLGGRPSAGRHFPSTTPAPALCGRSPARRTRAQHLQHCPLRCCLDSIPSRPPSPSRLSTWAGRLAAVLSPSRSCLPTSGGCGRRSRVSMSGSSICVRGSTSSLRKSASKSERAATARGSPVRLACRAERMGGRRRGEGGGQLSRAYAR